VLRRSLARPIAAAFIVLVTTSVRPSAALDNHDPPIVVESGDGFGIDTTVVDPGDDGAVGSGAEPVAENSAGVTCSYRPDTSNHSSGIPQWEVDAPHNGEEGAWFFRQCSDGSFTVVWVPAGGGAPDVPRVSPAELAVQAANYLPLPAPAVRHSPDRAHGRPQTIVGLETWFWVDRSTFAELRQSTSAGGVSATVTARPVSTVWRTGSPDAPDVVCPGPGVPYDTTRGSERQSTYCSTVYERSSAHRPQTGPDRDDRFFTGTATTVWRISWVGTGGAAGSLPDLRRTSAFQLAAAEIQAVNQ
jgi:hypothetical protein